MRLEYQCGGCRRHYAIPEFHTEMQCRAIRRGRRLTSLVVLLAVQVAIVLGLVFVLGAGPARAQDNTLNSAVTLKFQCEQSNPTHCVQYLLGVVDGANIERRYFCPPPKMVVAELPMMYTQYIRQHPEVMRENRLTAAYLAFRVAMPCDGKPFVEMTHPLLGGRPRVAPVVAQ